jgi:hypothetical protein
MTAHIASSRGPLTSRGDPSRQYGRLPYLGFNPYKTPLATRRVAPPPPSAPPSPCSLLSVLPGPKVTSRRRQSLPRLVPLSRRIPSHLCPCCCCSVMAVPLLTQKIVKKRVKQFKRPHHDRYICLKVALVFTRGCSVFREMESCGCLLSLCCVHILCLEEVVVPSDVMFLSCLGSGLFIQSSG